MASNKRMRGLAIHRSILIGNTSTPLTDVERITAPPDHTHRWTIAVRSAASHPLPTVHEPEQSTSSAPLTTPLAREDASRSGTPAAAPSATTTPAAAATASSAGVSTRGREHETDYHKMVGGKDDISHFIKRVQFKLHETYSQSTRNIDKPPFQVTETGWGEFDVQIRILFVPESGEKPITTYHRLKLHPWHPVTLRAPEPAAAQGDAPEPAMELTVEGTTEEADSAAAPSKSEADLAELALQVDVKREEEAPSLPSQPQAPMQQPPPPLPGAANVKHPPVVHSWSYDEIVFPEPTEAFYDILLANPPTPLPAQSVQAFADTAAYNRYQAALANLDESSGPQGRDAHRESGIKPPHALHSSSGALFDALSQEAIQAEAERFDKARFNAVHQLEETRMQLIESERRLREGRFKAGPAAPVT